MSGNTFLCLVLAICVLRTTQGANRPIITPVYQWKQLEFDYPTQEERLHDISHGIFNVGKPAPIDVDVYYSADNQNKIFVTIPRFQPGVPVTLGTVSSDKTLDGNPLVSPYPSWEWHKHPEKCKPNRVVSVYRVQVDECGRLWVLDTGRLINEQTCPAQILAFDLKTNELLHKYEIPVSQLESRSVLVTPVVDVRDTHLKCRDTFVYVADCQTYSIIVYDVRKNRSWRVTDKTMYPYPNYGTFSIQGDSFDLMDGILGAAIEPYVPGKDRKLFYHAMSSPTENWVFTSYLRNESNFIEFAPVDPSVFHASTRGRNTQSAAEAMDKDGIMYFGLMSDTSIGCWNKQTEYSDKNIDIIAQDSVTMQFASGVKVIKNVKGTQELWIMTSRFQKIATGTLLTTEVNFRIQAGKIEDLIFSSKCKSRGQQTRLSPAGGGYGLRPRPQKL